MQRTGIVRIGGKEYKVLIRTQTVVTEWVTLSGELSDEEPRFPQDYEIGLEDMLYEHPEMVEALKAGSTIRV